MRPARILLLLVALLAGGLAAFLATRGNAPQPQQVAVTEIQKEARTKILVASIPVGVGERLSAQNIEWQEWPEGAVRSEYVTINAVPDAVEKLTGAVARFEIFAGEPVREAKLALTDQGYLSAVLSPGMRGVSIGVSAEAGAGGFIVPNDRVDIVLTRKGSQHSETILQNVKVLAIGLRLGQLGKTGDANDPESEDPNTQTFSKSTIATLELTQEQSEVILNAGKLGNLALVLRSVADFAEKPEDLLNQKKQDNSTVRLIRFGKEQNVISGALPAESEGVTTEPVAYTPDQMEMQLEEMLQVPQVPIVAPPASVDSGPFAPPNPSPVE